MASFFLRVFLHVNAATGCKISSVTAETHLAEYSLNFRSHLSFSKANRYGQGLKNS